MNAYQNPVEPKVQVPALVNTSYETSHPLEPVVYIQLQEEALYGVRLGCARLSSLSVQFYGYNVARVVRDSVDEIEKLDVRMARDDADTHDVFHNETYARPGLVAAIRQSIPSDVVTLSERLAEVSWGFGHILSLADPEVYDAALKEWSLESLPIVPNQWQMVVPADKRKQFNVIKKLLASCSEVVIATDADREGEVIAREILEYVGYIGPISRLWLSALDDASVRKALGELKSGSETEALYWAGLGRSQADWLLGMNLTRLCTVAGRSLGYRGAWSVGRVQTPTLRLVVERDYAIANFVAKPFYDVMATVDAGFDAKWQVPEAIGDESGRCLSREAASQVVNQCQGQKAEVTVFDTKRQKAKHPALMFLGTLQKAMSAQYGYTAQQVLDTAQALYEKHKLTTYPRTDCAFLPVSQQGEVSQIFSALAKDQELTAWCQGADVSIKSACWNDKKVAQSSHHAIIPTTRAPNLAELNEREKNVYLAIVQRYLAQFYPHAEDDATVIELQCGTHRFKTTGKVERIKGWRVVTQGDEPQKGEGKGKKLLSTPAGRGLIQALPNEISNPVMTAVWEQALEGIASRSTTLESFMKSQESFVSAIVSKVKAGELNINLPKVVEPQAPCPLCGKTMRLRPGKRPFWACEDREGCNLILDNQRGKPAKNQKCTCGKGVLVRKSGKNKGSFYWSCSAWKQGCQKRHFDDKGKVGKEIGSSEV